MGGISCLSRRMAAGAMLGCGLALLSAWPASAEYPDHNIVGIVPFAVGGSSDILGRLVGGWLSEGLHQTVIVENKAGAGGNVGLDFVAKAKPDGYTLLLSQTATTHNPAMFKHMPFDPYKDIVPIAETSVEDAMVVVNAQKVPAKTLKEFVDLLAKNPGKYNGATGGTGDRIAIELFRLLNNVTVELVPYNSAGEAVTAVTTGEGDFAIVSPSIVGGGVQSGKLRALATTGDVRLAAFPDVPTTAEAGMPAYQFGSFMGIYGPGGIPKDIVNKINAITNQIVARPDVVQKLATMSQRPVKKTPEEFNQLYLQDMARWKDVVSRANIPLLD